MTKKKGPAQPELRAPTEQEVRAIAAAKERQAKRAVRATVDVRSREGNTVNIAAPHADQRGAFDFVEDTFGTGSEDFGLHALGLLSAVSQEAGNQGPDGRRLNSHLALVAAIAPENELEAALALQMAATHDLSMHLIGKAKHASRPDLMKEYGNLATKMSRTFTTQIKALGDMRRGGEQVVRHIHVYQGGQAVVADNLHVGGRNEGLLDQPHALGPAMLGSHPFGHGMPVAGSEGPAALSDARGQVTGRAEGE